VRVAALIINWNGAKDTLELLESLAKQKERNLECVAIIVDNNSDAQDYHALETGIKSISGMEIKLVKNAANEGVPSAYNRAIAASGNGFDYYLRLDNDVVLKEGSLARLIELLEKWRDQGARLVGCNIRYYDNEEESNCGAVHINLIRGKTTTSYPPEQCLVDGVLGCAMLIDGEVVRTYKPNVFLGWLYYTTDESELSMRCAARGWRTLYVPEPLVLHKGGRSTRKAKTMATLHSARNWAFLAMKYARPSMLVPLVAIRILCVSFPVLIIRGRWCHALALLRGASKALAEKVLRSGRMEAGA
jgi:GT2 family glycosyltransferase